MINCVHCGTKYKPESNLIKIGKHLVEVYNTDNKTNYNLCDWCEYDFSSGDYNEAK